MVLGFEGELDFVALFGAVLHELVEGGEEFLGVEDAGEVAKFASLELREEEHEFAEGKIAITGAEVVGDELVDVVGSVDTVESAAAEGAEHLACDPLFDNAKAIDLFDAVDGWVVGGVVEGESGIGEDLDA